MSWRDNLQPASYRGANFYVESSTHEGGRRSVVHQFLNRDEPYIEDIGEEAKGYTIEAYVVQNAGNSFDYFQERDALIRALQRKGAGLLIHPYYGFKKVIVDGKYSVSETIQDGGIARFSITFTEDGVRVVPKKIQSFLDKVDNAVNNAYDIVGDAFHKIMTTSGAFMDVTRGAMDAMHGICQIGLVATKAIPTAVVNEVIGNINIIKGQTEDILASPGQLFNALKNSFQSFAVANGLGKEVQSQSQNEYSTPSGNDRVATTKETDIFSSQLSIDIDVVGGETGDYSGLARGEITELDGNTVPQVVGTSSLQSISDQLVNWDLTQYQNTPDEQSANILQILTTAKFCLLANAAQIAIRTDFISQESVIVYRDLIAERMDEVILEIGDVAAGGAAALGIGTNTEQFEGQELLESLRNLLEVFLAGMNDKIENISATMEYTPTTEGENCLTLAYDRYEDLTRVGEVFDLNENEIRHPGFIPGGTDIKILEE